VSIASSKTALCGTTHMLQNDMVYTKNIVVHQVCQAGMGKLTRRCTATAPKRTMQVCQALTWCHLGHDLAHAQRTVCCVADSHEHQVPPQRHRGVTSDVGPPCWWRSVPSCAECVLPEGCQRGGPGVTNAHLHVAKALCGSTADKQIALSALKPLLRGRLQQCSAIERQLWMHDLWSLLHGCLAAVRRCLADLKCGLTLAARKAVG
jgi:hypothetical protein